MRSSFLGLAGGNSKEHVMRLGRFKQGSRYVVFDFCDSYLAFAAAFAKALGKVLGKDMPKPLAKALGSKL